MDHLTTWSKKSPLCINDWYWFAVKLVEEDNAKIIERKHFGGGNRLALQKMLTFWWDNTDDRSWEKIVDALKKLEGTMDIIESIEEECQITKTHS